MSLFTNAEADALSLDGLVNDNALVPTRRNGPKPSYQFLVDGWNAEFAAKIIEINKSRGFRVVGTFSAGFTYELLNDVGIDAAGNSWIYTGTDALPKVISAGTAPSTPNYQQVTYNDHSGLVNLNAEGGHDEIYARSVNSLKSLVAYTPTLIDGQKFDVTGFYANTKTGGGLFIWDASRSKTDHNGGTVIAPEALIAWDGTIGDIATLLDWNGAGSGCFVRFHTKNLVNSDFFSGDITKSAAGSDGIIQHLASRSYTSGVTLDGPEFRGNLISGAGGSACKSDDGVSVLSPATDQEFVLRLATPLTDADASPPELRSFKIDNITIDGENKNISSGLVHCHSLSQSSIENVTFKRSRGAGLNVRKMEDTHLNMCKFVFLGNKGSSESSTGALVLGKRLTGEGPNGWYETNITWINDGRFEWFDGGAIRLSPDNGRYNGLFINSTKFEVGTPVDVGNVGFTYGEYAGDYGVVHIPNSNPSFYAAKTILRNSWFENLQNSDAIIVGSNLDTMIFENNILQNDGSDLDLIKIKPVGSTPADSRNFVFKNNVFRSYSGSGNFRMKTQYESSRPCLFELPYHDGTPETCLQYTGLMLETYAHQASFRNKLKPNSDINDKTIGVLQSVASHIGAGGPSIVMFHLGSTANTDGDYGLTGKSNGLFSIKVRAKFAGSAGKIQIRHNQFYFGEIDVISTKFRWYELQVNMLETYKGESGVFINPKSDNADDCDVMIDCVRVTQIEELKRSKFSPIPSYGSLKRGTRIYHFDANPSESQGSVVTKEGTLGAIDSVAVSTNSNSNIVTVTSGSGKVRQGMYISIDSIEDCEVVSVYGDEIELSKQMVSTGVFPVSLSAPTLTPMPALT